MKIGIIAAMPEELVHLTQNLAKAQEVQVLENTYYTGTVGKTEVVLVQSGIGKVMSAMSVAVLADHFQVKPSQYRIGRCSCRRDCRWRCSDCG